MTNQDHVTNFCGSANALASQTKLMSDQELAYIYAMTRTVTLLMENTRKELISRCKAHGNAGGLILKPGSNSREIKNLKAAYVALRDIIPKEDFLKACSVSVTKLESIFADLQIKRGICRDYQEAKIAFNTALGDALIIHSDRVALTPAPHYPTQEDPQDFTNR